MQRKKLCFFGIIILLAIDLSICMDEQKIRKNDENTDGHGIQTYVIQPSDNPGEVIDDSPSTDSPPTDANSDSKDTSTSDGVSIFKF